MDTERLLGAMVQNGLVSTTVENCVAMKTFLQRNSRVRDTDIASASAQLAKNNILMNASIGVLGQGTKHKARR